MDHHPDPPPSRAERGALVSEISREIVRLHARLYGRGPTKARSYLHRDYAMCVLEEIFTTAERTLIQTGSTEHVQDTRLKFQAAVEPEFREVVETVTGRSVHVVISQVDIDADLAVELFLFEPEEVEDG
ncbi:MAG TPA: Na-translocating system protein MpsC family protein [Solirubrobacterales bacterium]|nr:Na-translocating system protein MpsC family protein [Solirubrobacterales bacterium]